MAKTATVRAMIEPSKKEEVNKILKQLGMNHSEAINIFYSMILQHNGMPFELKLSNGNVVNEPSPFLKAGIASINKNRKLYELLAK